MQPLDVQLLSECFSLDGTKSSGIVWKRRPRSHFDSDRAWKIFNSRYSGKEAGSLYQDAFGINRHIVKFKALGFHTMTARIVWAIANQKDPIGYFVDHKNRTPTDNRPENLRLASPVQNSINRIVKSRSGVQGVSFDKSRRLWIARAWVSGKTIFLGRFESKDDAISARNEATKTIYEEFNPLA